eukprot:CAMPEP_0194529056 /NCGR_PEP_ID=MMETSP0253-20130528/65612_1 /TAXON_ID=2966 /ORGANISM="Noctiluca scintillans" /LENGTH=138 /DNA_ID=CAMNT_0039374161 /DNA_START=141 /DNA_END=554 /DNA_ORIENTATION=-
MLFPYTGGLDPLCKNEIISRRQILVESLGTLLLEGFEDALQLLRQHHVPLNLEFCTLERLFTIPFKFLELSMVIVHSALSDAPVFASPLPLFSSPPPSLTMNIKSVPTRVTTPITNWKTLCTAPVTLPNSVGDFMAVR